MVGDLADDTYKQILQAKHKKSNLENEVKTNCPQLNSEQQQELINILNKFKQMFDGTLGTWKNTKYKIELKEGAKLYHSRPCSILQAYYKQIQLEVELLVKIGVLHKVNCFEWGASTFVIPKKDQTVIFVTNFRQLNKQIKRKPHPIPKIQYLLIKLKGFTFTTSLDLNMGYYHINLTPSSSALCTIVLAWDKYKYLKFPMGLANS